ncbi:MAG: hypothetical protein C0501_22710 [Isosphaera sp.]|nr:hypothetical protein [Isosphaera sp.]
MRTYLTAAAALWLAAPAAAQAPKLGVQTQVEFADKTPKGGTLGWRMFVFEYPIGQGDRFRVEAEPVGGAEMMLYAAVEKETGDGFEQVGNADLAGKVDYTNPKGLPGKRARVVLYSADVGKVNVRVTKVGVEPADDPRDATIKKLEGENAALRKELADVKAQLADIKRLLEKKK